MKNKDKIIKITDLTTGEVDYALNILSAAKSLNCTRQFIHYVLSDLPQYSHFKTAKNKKLEWIDIMELVNLKG